MTTEKKYHFIIAALGTRGDLNPLLIIGQALKRRGHTVVVLTDEGKRSLVEACSLGYHCVMSAEQWDAFIGHGALWDKETSDAIVYKFLMMPTALPIMRYLDSLENYQDTVLIGDYKTLGLRIGKDKYDLPLVNILLAPELNEALKQVDQLQQEKTVLALINSVRHQCGVFDDVREPSLAWAARTDLTMNAFPEWFMGNKTTENACSECFNFVMDEQTGESFPDDVEAFLSNGESPVVFTMGTGVSSAKTFFAVALKVCDALKIRGVFLCQESGLLPDDIPDTILVRRYLPMSQLLSRSRAIVHHGGVGTAAQAIKNATPQIVVPMAFDQFGNAKRIKQLGVGDTLNLDQLDVATLGEMLMKLMNDRIYSIACDKTQQWVQAGLGVNDMCQRLETLADKRCSVERCESSVDFI